MKFKCADITIEAVQYDGDFMNSNGKYYMPKWAVEALENGTLYYGYFYNVPAELFIKSPNDEDSDIHVDIDDYIVRFEDGTISSCAESMFQKLYQPAKE